MDNYMCTAHNFVHPLGEPEPQRRDGNATIAVKIRHPPGRAEILPEEAIAVAGRAVTLVCSASPPGYPALTYR
jgi:echinoid protein